MSMSHTQLPSSVLAGNTEVETCSVFSSIILESVKQQRIVNMVHNKLESIMKQHRHRHRVTNC